MKLLLEDLIRNSCFESGKNVLQYSETIAKHHHGIRVIKEECGYTKRLGQRPGRFVQILLAQILKQFQKEEISDFMDELMFPSLKRSIGRL